MLRQLGVGLLAALLVGGVVIGSALIAFTEFGATSTIGSGATATSAATSAPTSARPVPPTATRRPPSLTPAPPTATRQPPSSTAATPSATRRPPSSTPLPPTATRRPPSSTPAPSITAPASLTSTRLPSPSHTAARASETATPTPTRPAPTASPRPTICVPAPPAGWVVYTIRPGDTLFGLSLDFGVGLGTLQRVNCIVNPSDIRAGQRIFAPPDSPATATAEATETIPGDIPTITSIPVPSATPNCVPPEFYDVAMDRCRLPDNTATPRPADPG